MTRSKTIVSATVAVIAAIVAACGNSGSDEHAGTPARPSAPPSMPGMDMGQMPTGSGLAASAAGFTHTPATTTRAPTVAGAFTFRIIGPNERVVTHFDPEQTMLMHFYLVRSDMTGFAHLHPTMVGDGTR